MPCFADAPMETEMKRRKGALRGLVLSAVALCVVGSGVLFGSHVLPPRVQEALAGGFFTNGVCTAGSAGTSTGTPAVTYCNNTNTYPLTGNEQIPADTLLSGGQSPQ